MIVRDHINTCHISATYVNKAMFNMFKSCFFKDTVTANFKLIIEYV